MTRRSCVLGIQLLLLLSVLMVHTVVDARYLEKAILIPVNTDTQAVFDNAIHQKRIDPSKIPPMGFGKRGRSSEELLGDDRYAGGFRMGFGKRAPAPDHDLSDMGFHLGFGKRGENSYADYGVARIRF